MAENEKKGSSIFDLASKLGNDLKRQLVGINIPDVIKVIKESGLTKRKYKDEKDAEAFIAKALNEKFGGTHRQYNVGGYLGLKVDIDINEKIGIEIKLASQMNSSAIERLFGQVIYYTKRKYNENLLVLVIGTKNEYTEIIKEVERFVEDLDATFYYLEV